jgi:sugar phosphate isomerase/epimerase
MSQSPFASAVTVCLVAEAAQGPFVFHGAVEEGISAAKEVGFDAVELFLPDPHVLPVAKAQVLLEEHSLKLAAVGTGAGWLVHQYSLTSPEKGVRIRAVQFVKQLIDWAGNWGAPVIIGSMQGRHEPGKRDEGLERLGLALRELSAYALETNGSKLLYEPLNRYETNYFHRLDDTAKWLTDASLDNVQILADLFHMNIEESDLPDAIRRNGAKIGHVHWADSNRKAMGWGHTHANEIAAALRDVSYAGYLSAEVFPIPDSKAAAKQTMESIRSA